MRTEGCEAQTLRALASMPFLDRTEMVAVTGWSKAAVHEAVDKLDSGGFCAAVPHATALFPSPTQRFHLTAAGLGRLAEEEEASLDELVRDRPVSAQWRRNLMGRLDSLATIYRLAAAVSGVAYPIRFRWYRASTLDAAVELPGGRTVGIVRQGLTADRTGFSNRMWRLRQGPLPGAVLVLMADDVRLRHVRRTLAGAPVPFYLALEREAVAASPDDPVWSPPAVSASVELRSVLDRIEKGSLLPEEDEPRMVSVPADLSVEGPGWKVPDYLLPATLKPAEKRALDLISDWPWITLTDLAGMLAVSVPRASQLVTPLEGFRLVTRPIAGSGRMALTDRALALLARRDRTSVAVAKKRWSAAPLFPGTPFVWDNVTGARSRQLLRNVEHTAAVHAFLPPSPCRRACWIGRSPRSTRPAGPHDTSSTATGCARSTPTPSASSERARPRGPSCWSGSGGPCGPRPCRSASPPICATSPLTGPPTTTARGPPSSSSSTTRSSRPTSCAWRGTRCRPRA